MLNFPIGIWLKRRFDGNDCAWTLLLPPWASRRERDMRRFRQLARRVLRRRLVAERGWGGVLALSVAWPAMAGLKAWLAARAMAEAGSRTPAQKRSFFDLWWVQLAHNIRISDQETLLLGSPEQRAVVGLCIPCFEHQVLMDLINWNTGLWENEEKRGFARFCAAHHLPSIEVLAESDGRETVQFQPLPHADLFLKPADLFGGKGIIALPFDAQRDCWVATNGENLIPAEVLAYSGRVQAGHPWILQRRLRNAPAWARWSPGALCTVRVVTGRTAPGAPVEVVGGFMRFPQGNAIVDNCSCGGLSADYNPATGRLGPARDPARPWIPLSHHPDTHAAIVDEAIPAWDRVRALALRAHGSIPHIAMIGWDVALPGDEPVLVEMNLNWGVFTSTPLGSTRYLDLVGPWLDTPTPAVAAFMAIALNA